MREGGREGGRLCMHILTCLIEFCLREHWQDTAFLAQEPMKLPEGPVNSLQNLRSAKDTANRTLSRKKTWRNRHSHLLARWADLLLLVAVAHQPLVSSRHFL